MTTPPQAGSAADFPGSRGQATATFLFADLEGSTRLIQRFGTDYEPVLDRYRALLRTSISQHGGREVGTEGDGLFAAFGSARAAVTAAAEAQRALHAESWPEGMEVRARMGVHTGEASTADGDYVGLDVHRGARITDAAHGGQVLLSDATRVLVERVLPDAFGLRDLGQHRLRDLAEPERLYQLVAAGLPTEFPPPRGLDLIPNNLPTQVTSFVGRTKEVDHALQLIADTRLLTLTGPGGTGKTRLALQVAACATDRFADGVWFVPLAPVRNPELVPATILQVLGVRENPSRPLNEQLLEHLERRHLLLVLDNFEQVLEAAPLVTDILKAAPAVTVLATSRASLRVSGEHELPVPPLGLPDTAHLPPLAALTQYEAVQLFVERAVASKPGFAVTNDNAPAVAEICARLDGLPLAIELAAARIKLLPPEAMLARLEHGLALLGGGPRDLPARQQTLRAAIAWSYELLHDPSQRLFRQLGAFAGGWTLPDAEAVCGHDLDILTELGELVEHSLVRQDESDGDLRFLMLETIREFAAEQLDANPEAAEVRQRHAERFLELAEEARPHLLGPDQGAWTDRLEREQHNLRAAEDWFVGHGQTASALRLVAALWRYWQKRHVDEGLARVRHALALPGTEEHPEDLSSALEALGGLVYWQGKDMEAAREPYMRALEIERALGDPGRTANALYNLSFVYSFSTGPERAQPLLAESLLLATEAADPEGVAQAHWGMGVNAFFRGDLDEATDHLDESLDRARALGNNFLTGWALHMLDNVALQTGDLPRATRLAREALHTMAHTTDHAGIALLLDDFAAIAGASGQPERQARLAAASLVLQQRSGSELARSSAEMVGRTPLDPDAFADAWEDGLAMTLEEAIAYALAGD